MSLHILLVGVLLQANIPAQRVASAAEFRDASLPSKRLTLNELAAHKMVLPADAMVDLIALGLREEDASVRLLAVNAAAGRAGAARFGDGVQKVTAAAERPVLRRLRPELLRVVAEDPDARVRRAGIISLVNLDYEGGAGPSPINLGEDFAHLLGERFVKEPDPGVMTEIVKTFALTTSGAAVRERVLVAGLSNSAAQVVSYSVMGLARSKPIEALPRIAALLRSTDRNTRLQVAQALAAYGPAATGYIPQVEQAVNAEEDDTVRRSLQGTLELLRMRISKQNKPKLLLLSKR